MSGNFPDTVRIALRKEGQLVAAKRRERGCREEVAVTLYKDITQIIMIVNILTCVLLKF